MPVAKPSVLFVMNDAKLRGILVNRFVKEGWKADGTDDLAEGERKSVRFRPKILALECAQAGATLKKTLKHLRSLPTLHTAKVICLLRRPSRELVDEVTASGADGVMLLGSLAPREVVKLFWKYVQG